MHETIRSLRMQLFAQNTNSSAFIVATTRPFLASIRCPCSPGETKANFERTVQALRTEISNFQRKSSNIVSKLDSELANL